MATTAWAAEDIPGRVSEEVVTKAILLGGYYGAGNVGDEAILSAMLHDLYEMRPRLEVTIVSWDPEETRRRTQTESVDWRDIGGLVDAARASDLILVGGGGLFHDHWGLDPETYLRRGHGGITTYGSLPLLARIFGIPCMLYGVGVGPLKSELAREHTRLAVERCQRVTLRDQSSYGRLVEAGFDPDGDPETRVRVCADPAFRLPTSLPNRSEAEGLLRSLGIEERPALLGVNVRYWDRPSPPEEWAPTLARGLDAFLERHAGTRAVLIPFQVREESLYTDDRGVARRVRREMEQRDRAHVVREPLSPSTAQALIGRCDLFLGMRYHSLVMAAAQGVPPVGLPYDPKVASLMEELGLARFCLPSYTPSPDVLADSLHAAWVERDELAGEVMEAAGDMKRRAEKSAVWAVGLLDREAPPPGVGLLQDQIARQIKIIETLDRALEAEEQRAGRFLDPLWSGLVKAIYRATRRISPDRGGE